MQVYPNPVLDNETITISSESGEDVQAVNLDNKVNRITKISLIDERQRVLQDYLPNVEGNLTTVKLNAVLKGTYLLKATFEDGTVQTKRVVVEK